MTTTTIDSNRLAETLFMALELSSENWKLAFATASNYRVRVRSVSAGDLRQLNAEIRAAKKRFRLDEDAPIISGYEAGRDGFWIHRALLANGIENLVLDASSLPVDQRSKRVKTDRVDAEAMAHLLVRYGRGETWACRLVHVPPSEDEDARHLGRELQTIRAERTRHSNRITSLLVTHGIRLPQISADFLQRLDGLRSGDGHELGQQLRDRLRREFRRLQLCVEQIRELEAARASLFRQAREAPQQAARRDALAVKLMELRGIGPEGAWTLASELFSWREIRNRRQLGALVGLTPCPYHSGKSETEQGISKAGRPHLRSLMIELSWLWLTYQPGSALTKWFTSRTRSGSRRVRRIAIVGLARKLLIALWKYAMHDELPTGATLTKDLSRSFYPRTVSLGSSAAA
jgi:transposase